MRAGSNVSSSHFDPLDRPLSNWRHLCYRRYALCSVYGAANPAESRVGVCKQWREGDMVERDEDPVLRAKYRDYCSAKVADAVLSLPPTEVYKLARGRSARRQSAGARVLQRRHPLGDPQDSGTAEPPGIPGLGPRLPGGSVPLRSGTPGVVAVGGRRFRQLASSSTDCRRRSSTCTGR